MKIRVRPAKFLKGKVSVPASKSHTIRGVVIASLAEGRSELINPLESLDTIAAANACTKLGARIKKEEGLWIVEGFGRKPCRPDGVIDLMNSGTSFNLICGVCSLGDFEVLLDGDDSLRTRPVEPLLKALNMLGACAFSVKGKPPVKIKGPIKGGKTEVDGISSQFVSSLLISTPLAEFDTEIKVVNLHEAPYVMMTLDWLNSHSIVYKKKEDLSYFYIQGKQKYHPFVRRIPGDWSSATFPLVAAAIVKSDVIVEGIDTNDVQGDKKVIEYLRTFGASVNIEKEGIRISKGNLKGTEIDLNSTPDALPAIAVCGCVASGTTRLFNVAHARIKETDRIAVMEQELRKMGAKISQLPDGLIIQNSRLKGAVVDGHGDHRVVMALAIAGLVAEGETVITKAESVSVTFPDFFKVMNEIGADIEKIE